MAKKKLLAKDIEIKAPVTISMGMTVPEAAKQMLKFNSSYLIVVDGAFKPVGIVTEKDFMNIIAQDKACNEMPIEEVMSKPLISTTCDSPLEDCVDILKRNGIKHLPVTKVDGKLHGVVTWKELYMKDASVVVETHPEALYVISKKNGLLLFEYSFPGAKKGEISGDLFSGAVASFNMMFNEVLHSNGELRFIEIENYAILAEYGNFTISIVVQDQESIDSRKRLKLFEKEFETRFFQYLEQYSDKRSTNVFDGAKEIVEELFSTKISR
nr:CBS domain-containing protein [Candidatus Sigynarchaeota archaeon]